jgi:hypothetical protein
MTEQTRSAQVRLTADGYVVDLYERVDDNLILRESRALPGKSIYYAMDVLENWNSGLIKL